MNARLFRTFSPMRLQGLRQKVDQRYSSRGFSLIELLLVVAIMASLTGVAGLAVTSLKNSNDVTDSAEMVSSFLTQAKAYAIANNTYVWVGFFEEDGSKPSATPAASGTGRVVLSMVASTDGTQIYDPSSPAQINSSKLLAVRKLERLNNLHLATFDDGSGTGEKFDSRPALGSDGDRIGAASSSGSVSFAYPVGAANSTQYTFSQLVEFSPRGSVRVSNNDNNIKPLIEVGLQKAHGATIDQYSQNQAAVQITGISGQTFVYRK